MEDDGVETLIAASRARLGDKGVVTDEHEIAPWTLDWRKRYRGTTRAILAPASTAETAAVVALAAAYRVPLVPQGGNTSMVGGATPPPDGSSLILSLRRMNRIRSLDPHGNTCVAEAGVILSNLHDRAAAAGLRFPLGLAAKGSATIGGLVSTNAGGTQVLRYGTMRRLTLGVEAILPDGSVWNGLQVLKKDNRGYDVSQLLIGAEGTLGVVTAATLQLVAAAADRAVGWLAVRDPAHALRLLRHMEASSGAAIESFEIMPRSAIELVLKHIPATRSPLAGRYPWFVLVEYIGLDAYDRLTELIDAALRAGLADDAVVATNERQAQAFWQLRETISEAERAEGSTIAHDISVPVEAMPAFMIDAGREVEHAFPGVVASAFGHLGDGNVHFHVRAPAGVDDDQWQAGIGNRASNLVYDLVTEAGGSISAEHGIGQMKRDELARLGEPIRLQTLRAIKQALDPLGIMNPGKLV